MKRFWPARLFLPLVTILILVSWLFSSVAGASPTAANGATPTSVPRPDLPKPATARLAPASAAGSVREGDPSEREDWFYSLRTAGDPSRILSVGTAAAGRFQAAQNVLARQKQPGARRATGFGTTWTPDGPNPTLQDAYNSNQLRSVSGRVSALAISATSPYTIYLGAAQGGIWESTDNGASWTPKTDQLPSLAIGSIALGAKGSNYVYVGTGEGNLSGDSYYGNGVFRSTDGGATFLPVSTNAFTQTSIAKLAVDPSNDQHLYAATVSGVSGAVDVLGLNPTPSGIYESNDAGVSWTQVYTPTSSGQGVTDLAIDPKQPLDLYATVLGQGIIKSNDGGQTWAPIMNGLPPIEPTFNAYTRFAIGISDPVTPTLYAGFDYYDTRGNFQPAEVWKSTDDGANWIPASTLSDSVSGYCGSSSSSDQCWYDNVIAVDPADPNKVYALGLFDYSTGTGGIYRSDNGGSTWADLGAGLHPDFHAIAIRPSATQNIVIGNDGGVWGSSNYGTTWTDLNGAYDSGNGQVTPSGLQIGQFQSVVQNPSSTGRAYGGLQDNGGEAKDSMTTTWYDRSGGDGGQYLIDATNAQYVYGEYFDVNPYRFSDGMTGASIPQTIVNGLNTNDESLFYIPLAMDPADPSRLYLGTYRLYRSDNRGDLWTLISGDLTSGCTGRASNGAKGCVISAIGVTAGAPTVYVGTADGLVQVSTNADSALPTWTEIDKSPLPDRPVSAIAVDRSNDRIAYVAYSSFNGATPANSGHVFKTTDAGQTWNDISGNLPDVPVNSIVLDPSKPNTLYVGTDVGPLSTSDGGVNWNPVGTNFPIVSVFQLDLNPYTGILRAATHGRGVWKISEIPAPALQLRSQSDTLPTGPGGLITYTVTLQNVSSVGATGVAITAPVPVNTTFVSAIGGGTVNGNSVVWNGESLTAAAVTDSTYGSVTPSSLTLSYTVRVSNGVTTGTTIINNGPLATSNEGAGASGSPTSLTISAPYMVSVSPSSQNQGTRPGQTITTTVGIENLGSNSDSYSLAVSGNAWPTTILNPTCSSPLTQTQMLAPQGTASACLQVTVPSTAVSGMSDTVRLTVTSRASPTTTGSATITTSATYPILLVDGDGNAPDVDSYYQSALTDLHLGFDTWDLLANPTLPLSYMQAHAIIIWYTGSAYPDPVGLYEANLATFLDSGGRLFISGEDILDGSAGSAAFFQNYVHLSWNDTNQNDKGTLYVTGVSGNPVTNGIGSLPIDDSVLHENGNNYSDEVVPIGPATAAFTDDQAKPDALTVSAGAYKVVFLAFPFEEMGTATDRAALMGSVLTYFDPTLDSPTPTSSPTRTSTATATPTGPGHPGTLLPAMYLPLIRNNATAGGW
ncbi:MAG TPA: hypothetical protein VMW65_00565 [Chloroflexota bacterium]|nr:hypothetical protein [Chloroflexota bacterium]